MMGLIIMEKFHLSVHIQLLTTDEGGRHGPILSGYRPTFYFEHLNTDGAVYLVDRNRVLPGDEFDAQVILLHPEHVGDALKPGARFEIKEGLHKVAEGEVLSVFLPAKK